MTTRATRLRIAYCTHLLPDTRLRIAYATHLLPNIIDAARKCFGSDVEIAGTPNCAPEGPLATWPYPASQYVVIGRAAAHRTGPLFTVVRRVPAEAKRSLMSCSPS